MELQIVELPNGNLEIRPYEDYMDADSMDYLKEKQMRLGDVCALLDATEDYHCNGSYQPFDAGEGNPFVGLTEAPCIAEGMDYDDDGNATINGRFWYYGDYMITSFIDEIIENGKVIFTLARG